VWVWRVKCRGKAEPLHTQKGPESSRKLRFPDFVTTAQDGGRLSVLRTGRLYLQEMVRRGKVKVKQSHYRPGEAQKVPGS